MPWFAMFSLYHEMPLVDVLSGKYASCVPSDKFAPAFRCASVNIHLKGVRPGLPSFKDNQAIVFLIGCFVSVDVYLCSNLACSHHCVFICFCI